MSDWIAEHRALLGWLVGVSAVTFVATLVIIPMLVVRIPEDYFLGKKPHRMAWWQHHPVLRVVMKVVFNLAGWTFIVAGLAMLILPGQGIITIVVGLMLIDFPGKFGFERWLVQRKPVHRAMNWMRRRVGRAELQLPVE